MKQLQYLAAALLLLCSVQGYACSNIIVTRGASADGSCMVSYAADSHWLFGELYFRPATSNKAGALLPIREWDSNRPLGSIAQVPSTFQTVGNQNEHQLIIGETTWGGREEQVDTTGIMDYGSLIYVTLQRARTAREAISTIVALANEYGYPSGGETFSIADTQEAWVMDLVGKGSPAQGESGHPGIVWVARRIPDGYICAHANQARITRFPLNDPENCLYAPDVIGYARSRGWYSGADADFSFREAYNPLDFGAARGCDARVWSAFNRLCDGRFTFGCDAYGKTGCGAGNACKKECAGCGKGCGNGAQCKGKGCGSDAGCKGKGCSSDGECVMSRPATDWLNYAMGYDLAGEMPLWVKPERKLTPKDIADAMRDHFEGTPMDMTQDIGAGGNECPYRWRPMGFEWEGKKYVNERAIATQQTGFWFVAQARGWLPDVIGALQWFGCDDAATSYLTPVYVNTKKVPECLREGNGDLLHYSANSQFWICNRVAQACYKMYNSMAPVARAEIDRFENEQMFAKVPEMDARAARIMEGKGLFKNFRVRRLLTKYTVGTAMDQLRKWVALEELLLVKFIDGNVKAQGEDGAFLHSEWGEGIPAGLTQPGYSDRWKAAVVRDHGEIIRER